jgi:hypothetical protein
MTALQDLVEERFSAMSQPVQEAKSVDISKDPVAREIHMCALLPTAAALLRPSQRLDHVVLRIAVVTTWAPRPCGIATFAGNLLGHLEPALPNGSTLTVFPILVDTVRANASSANDMALRQENFGDYIRLAHHINSHGYNVVLLQHEFGIYGGASGAFATCLARMLSVPLVSVLHTLSDNLNDENHYNLQHLVYASAAVVVMSNTSRNHLGAYHGVSSEKVVVIPHGVPSVPNGMVEDMKARLNLTGRTVLLTNGLINPGKRAPASAYLSIATYLCGV